MKDLTLKEIIKDNTVTFSHYKLGYLYYNVRVEEIVYMFPVSINNIGDVTFLNKDKAIIFMRYIRQALIERTFVKIT